MRGIMKNMLRSKKCIPCHDKNIEPLSREDTARFNEELSGWPISLDNNHVTKDFVFETFEQSIDFINKVASVASAEDHHPDIHCFYNKVTLDISTHAISGLTENDFILASKIDGILE